MQATHDNRQTKIGEQFCAFFTFGFSVKVRVKILIYAFDKTSINIANIIIR